MIKIYTDGSCLSNPGGAGGWACCIIEDDKEYYYCDGDPNTTNNRMELKAIIEGLSCIKENKKCIIYSDSKLTINCATSKWSKKSNLDLWEEYEKVSKNKDITLEWVKAHSGNYYNEKVDKLAYEEALKMKKK
jgi:ribonuclease HI